MKYYLYLLLFLPLCNSAQTLPYDTPAFKTIEKNSKSINVKYIGISILSKIYKVTHCINLSLSPSLKENKVL